MELIELVSWRRINIRFLTSCCPVPLSSRAVWQDLVQIWVTIYVKGYNPLKIMFTHKYHAKANIETHKDC
jgi:hypothetical protein